MRARKALALRLLVHAGLLLPLALLLWDLTHGRLTANPIRVATLRTGDIALVLLVLSLASGPAYNLLGFRPLFWLRRTLGLYALAYTALHVLIFVGVDYGFDLELLRGEILEKRYALAGLVSFLLLVPPAITSTGGWSRRLGRHWGVVHRAVYLAAVFAVLHYLWLVKVDAREPLAYGGIVLFLLLLRLPLARRAMHGLHARIGAYWGSLHETGKTAR